LLNAKAVMSLLRIKYLSDTQNEINASNLGSTPSVQVSNASGRVSGLTNNTLYYFAITAVKDGVEGSQSAMVTATSPIGSPSLDNLSDKYLILNSDITAFAFNNTNIRPANTIPS
jgi:hypothetical protein